MSNAVGLVLNFFEFGDSHIGIIPGLSHFQKKLAALFDFIGKFIKKFKEIFFFGEQAHGINLLAVRNKLMLLISPKNTGSALANYRKKCKD